MDGSSGYNQIFMAEEDKLHITFRTPKGIYCCKVMPFGLKNAGATVKKVMTHIFDDLLHKHVECYVNDFVVKSKRREDHLADLRIVFEGFRKYNLKMNPLKCVFGVSSGFAWDTAMAGRSDEYAVSACVQESSGEHPGWSESKTVTKQGGQPIVQPTSRAKYEDKMTGSYERYTAKEKVSSGQQFVERSTGRVGFKDVQQRSSTVKIGDKSGYTE